MKTCPLIGVLLGLLCSINALLAQQLPVLQQYRNMGYVANPAMTGWQGEEAVGIFYRYQWTALPGAPRTGYLAYDSNRLMEEFNTALSAYVYHDRTGPTMTNGVGGSYAYHIELEDYAGRSHHISLGFQASMFQHRLDGDELFVIDADDDLVIGDRSSAILPEVGAGIFYYNEFMGMGISAPQILGLASRFSLDNEVSYINRARHFYAQAYAKIPLGYAKETYLMPSVWAKYAQHSPLNVDMNMRLLLNETYMVGLGYSTSHLFSAEFGLELNKTFRFGYSYSTQFSEWTTFLGDSHELFLIYVIQNNGQGWY